MRFRRPAQTCVRQRRALHAAIDRRESIYNGTPLRPCDQRGEILLPI
jgi:hypothetical protein